MSKQRPAYLDTGSAADARPQIPYVSRLRLTRAGQRLAERLGVGDAQTGVELALDFSWQAISRSGVSAPLVDLAWEAAPDGGVVELDLPRVAAAELLGAGDPLIGLHVALVLAIRSMADLGLTSVYKEAWCRRAEMLAAERRPIPGYFPRPARGRTQSNRRERRR